MCLATQMYPGRTSYVQDSFKDATSAPRGYLLFYLHQETLDFHQETLKLGYGIIYFHRSSK